MNAELIIAIASALGAVVSIIAAISAFRRDDIQAQIETYRLAQSDTDRKRQIAKEVAEDTVGLYRKLASQYEEMNEKDKKLLKTISFVIRKMIILERTIIDLITEMEIRWEGHHPESESVNCPYFHDMTGFMLARMQGIEEIVTETMTEIDTLLLNGTSGQDDEE